MLTTVGLIVLAVGIALIVIAFVSELGQPSPGMSRGRAPSRASPAPGILDAVARVLKAFGEMMTAILGMFRPIYRPGIFLSLLGLLLAIVGAFV